MTCDSYNTNLMHILCIRMYTLPNSGTWFGSRHTACDARTNERAREQRPSPFSLPAQACHCLRGATQKDFSRTLRITGEYNIKENTEALIKYI